MTAVLAETGSFRAEMLQRGRRLPAAPLVSLVEASGGYSACAGIGQHHTTLARAWERAKVDGALTCHAADKLAIELLGLHPLLVWGDDWLELLWELDAHPPQMRRRTSAA